MTLLYILPIITYPITHNKTERTHSNPAGTLQHLSSFQWQAHIICIHSCMKSPPLAINFRYREFFPCSSSFTVYTAALVCVYIAVDATSE